MTKTDIEVRRVEPSEYPEWRKVLASSNEGSAYQMPEYLEALADATGGKFKILGLYRNQTELLGGIGLYLKKTYLGTAATSRLLLYYNGPFLRPAPSALAYRRESYRNELLGVLEKHLRSEGLESILFKAREAECDYRSFISRGWSAKPFYSYLIPLHDIDNQLSLVDKNLRRLIRRGRELGLTFTENGDFNSFFDMHEETHRRKRSPMYLPRDNFRQFVDTLVTKEIGRLFQVSLPSGEPIASQLVLTGQHPVAHTLAASAFESHQSTGCNALLRWNTCKWLSAKGYEAIDLTDAHNPSVAKFKRSLGATLTMGLQVELPARAPARLFNNTVALSRRAINKVRRVVTRRN
jgi:hypothetical protein